MNNRVAAKIERIIDILHVPRPRGHFGPDLRAEARATYSAFTEAAIDGILAYLGRRYPKLCRMVERRSA